MKQQGTNNGNKPVTVSNLKTILRQSFADFEKRYDKKVGKRFTQTDKRFAQMDKRFAQMDRTLEIAFRQIDNNFAAINGKLAALVGITSHNIDRAVSASEERLNKKLDQMIATMNTFIKRTEENEREIGFLGKQHDDLAKYCTAKIEYPEYGRKL